MSSSPSVIHVYGDWLDYLLHAYGETQEQWNAPFWIGLPLTFRSGPHPPHPAHLRSTPAPASPCTLPPCSPCLRRVLAMSILPIPSDPANLYWLT